MQPDIQPPSMVPGNPWQNQYSSNLAGNMPYGIGGLMTMLFGQQMWPLMNGGTPQSQFDAVWKRQHSLEMMQIGRQTVSSIFPIQNLGGMNQNSTLSQVAAMMLSQPDGMAATMMAPFLGGNPIQAQMSSLANLQGVGAAGLGTLAGTSIGQLNTAREIFESGFYNSTIQPISKEDGARLKKSISSNISQMYGSGFSTSDLFDNNRNNEINRNSQSYKRIVGYNDVVNRAVGQASSGSSADSIIRDMNNDKNNTLVDRSWEAKQVRDAFAESQGNAKDAMTKSWTDSGLSLDGKTGGVLNDAYNAFRSGKSQEDILRGVTRDTNGMGLSDADLKKMTEAIKDGCVAGGKVIGDSVSTKMQQATSNRIVGDMNDEGYLETGKRLTRGVNFNNTYGFNYEDLTGARDAFIKNRMTSGSLNDLSDMFNGHDRATVSMLDSARSLFGNNLTGQQLGNTISQFVGYDKFNVNDDKSKANFESMARNLKATAREMNMDPSDLLNLTSQAQKFGQMSPATSRLGGLSLAPVISDEAIKIAAISSHMDSDTVRWMGGTEGMLTNRVQGMMESADQPITKQLAAIRTFFKGDTNTLKKVDAYIGNGNFTQAGYNGFLQSLPANPSELMTYANSDVSAQQMGFKDLENADPEKFHKLMNVGSAAMFQQARQSLALKAAGGGMGVLSAQGALAKLDGYLKKGDISGLETDRDLNKMGMAPIWKKLADNGGFDDPMIALNPVKQAEVARAKAAIKANAGMEAEIANKMGKMNAPLMTRLVQAMTTGDSSGLTGVLDAFGISSKMGAYSSTIAAQRKISQISGANSIEDVVTNATGRGAAYSKQMGEFSSFASKFGVKGDRLQEILKTNGDKSKLRNIVDNKSEFDKASNDDIDKFYHDALGVSPDFNKSTDDFSIKNWKDHYTKQTLDDTIDLVTDRREIEAKQDADVTSILKKTGSADSKSLLQMGTDNGGVFSFIEKFNSETDQEQKDGKFKMGDLHKKWAEAQRQQDPSKFAGVDFNAEYTAADLGKINEKVAAPLKNEDIKKRYDQHEETEAKIQQAKDGGPLGSELKQILTQLGKLPEMATALTNIANTLATLK